MSPLSPLLTEAIRKRAQKLAKKIFIQVSSKIIQKYKTVSGTGSSVPFIGFSHKNKVNKLMEG